MKPDRDPCEECECRGDDEPLMTDRFASDIDDNMGDLGSTIEENLGRLLSASSHEFETEELRKHVAHQIRETARLLRTAAERLKDMASVCERHAELGARGKCPGMAVMQDLLLGNFMVNMFSDTVNGLGHGDTVPEAYKEALKDAGLKETVEEEGN
jgi:hypothetical protein